ncbi:ATP-binding protein [Desulfobulbus sp.]|jgi:PAS domain S-box-containing protein|uniref:ATP-binding protein n=1 Tax=Desulfobulbus sp. TaxID=895 RepID=UPI0028525F06|nr:ATP-binding protein [Desulfobulbus sp.]
MASMPWNKHSIAYRLTFVVILFSSLIACFSTALQLYLDYRRDIEGIDTFFNIIPETSTRPLEESVWILDELQVNLQLEGLINREYIVYAAVRMDGLVAWASGTPSPADSVTRVYPLRHLVRERVEEIGQLEVTASYAGIHQRLAQRFAVLLASNAVKTFLVSGFIFFCFQKYLTRHLTNLARCAENVDLKNRRFAPMRLERSVSRQPDELDRLVSSLNFLCMSGHKALADLETQGERLRLFLDATEEVVLGVDSKGRCTFINRAGQEQFGAAGANGFIGRDILTLFAAGGPEAAHTQALGGLIRATVAEGKAMHADEMPLELPDGSSLSVSLRAYPVFEDEQCTGAVVFYADISRQQQLEQEKLLFTKMIRQAPALILVTDSEGVIEYVNASFEQVMECDGAELRGKRAFDCLPGLDLAEQATQVMECIGKDEPWTGRLTRLTPQGRTITLTASVFPILDGTGRRTHVVAMGRDRTREQQLVEQLHHAQKMEAVGKLAASIAHEFGNPLLGISFALRDVQQRVRQDDEAAALLQLASEECDRMRKLIRDLRQFNRPSTGRKTVFDLNRLLEDILTLHRNFFNERRIVLERSYAGQALQVHAVEDQIRQVFINLIINAADAMAEHGGTLNLATAGEGDRVMACVEDSGPGIAPEQLGKIFEPFYTTKAVVEGSGLGLSVSYGIVRAHGGRIEVRSEPGRTVFRVSLPAAEEDAA